VATLTLCAPLLAQISPSGGAPSNPPQPSNLSPIINPAPAAGSATAPDIHDLHALAPLTFWEKHGTEILLYGTLGLALAIFIGWLLLRKKPVPPLTPYEQALLDLQFAHGFQDTGQDKVFAIAASDAVRRYLESAYQMPAPERTTEEFLQVAASHAWLQGELTALLRRFLEFCDLAKFAGQQFGTEERAQLLNAAREFIDTAEKFRRPKTGADDAENTGSNPPPAPTPAQPALSAP